MMVIGEWGKKGVSGMYILHPEGYAEKVFEDVEDGYCVLTSMVKWLARGDVSNE
ncbi:MAG: hypothetical protein GX998_08970 [Firmicutes bacterium]|nr:hypothetical protein [Bacillota bacterium]